MKTFLFLLVLSCFVYGQRDDTKLIWFDAYTTANPYYGSTVVTSDTVADNEVTIKKGDTLYVDLYVSRVISTYNAPMQYFTFFMEYGHNEYWQPNSYWGQLLNLRAVTIDSLGLYVKYGTYHAKFQSIADTNFYQYMFTWVDTSGSYPLKADSQLVTFTFIASKGKAGKQILYVPTPTGISKDGYTKYFWSAMMNDRRVGFPLKVSNLVITVE